MGQRLNGGLAGEVDLFEVVDAAVEAIRCHQAIDDAFEAVNTQRRAYTIGGEQVSRGHR
jgi:hypothetical protein